MSLVADGNLERLLALPDHLRLTMVSLIRGGISTASDVARATGKARAVESGYLNQLVRLGYVVGQRRGRKRYFSAVVDDEFADLTRRINALPMFAQKMLLEDLLVALKNRLKVLERVNLAE